MVGVVSGKGSGVGAWQRLADFLRAEQRAEDLPDVLRRRYAVLLDQAEKAIATDERKRAAEEAQAATGVGPRRNQPRGRSDVPLVDDATRQALKDDDSPVDALPVRATTLRALAQADVHTVGELVTLPPGFVESLPGVGSIVVRDVRAALVRMAVERDRHRG